MVVGFFDCPQCWVLLTTMGWTENSDRLLQDGIDLEDNLKFLETQKENSGLADWRRVPRAAGSAGRTWRERDSHG